MPELPEVETVVRTLTKQVISQPIIDFYTTEQGISAFGSTNFLKLKNFLVGTEISEIARRGKFIIFNFSSQTRKVTVVGHLRMTGRFIYVPNSTLKTKSLVFPEYLFSGNAGISELDEYVRFSIKLQNGELLFSDKRRFGTFHLVEEGSDYPGLTKLGVEPLSDEFTAELLFELLKKRKKSIYAVMMDQSIIAGIGNIYAAEILFESRVHPERLAMTISFEESNKLVKAIKTILTKAIENQGTSFSDYLNSSGEKGKHQHALNVYGQDKVRVKDREYIVVKLKHGGRSVYCVPELQI